MTESVRERLQPFERRGGLEKVDVHLALTLLRLDSTDDPDMALAAALASRAPRHGHICVELNRVTSSFAEEEDQGDNETLALPWPKLEEWLKLLADWRLVRLAGDSRETPLVLDGQRLYLDRYWRYQERLLDVLQDRAGRFAKTPHGELLRDGLSRLFPTGDQSAEPDRQRLAALVAVLRGLTVISGGPGTGKTTTVKKILALLLEQHLYQAKSGTTQGLLRIGLAAPTAKAATRLGEALGEDLDNLKVDDAVKETLQGLQPKTIHRLLGARRSSSPSFRYSAENPLPYDVVVIDEASMIDFALMTRLVEAVPRTSRLVLLGDRDQLASVEAGSVLGDICGPAGTELCFSPGFIKDVNESAGVNLADLVSEHDRGPVADCMIHLTRVYRYGKGTGISAVARAINAGEERANDVVAYLRHSATMEKGPGTNYTDVELHEVGADEMLPTKSLQMMVDGFLPLIEAVESDEVDQALEAMASFRVLCAHRRGKLGVSGVVSAIEKGLEKACPWFNTSHPFYLGRPVLVRQNDYNVGLFNGDFGIVVRHPETKQRTVAFPRVGAEPRYVGPARLPPHVTVFATTVHQGQGSQFEHVVVVLPSRPSQIVTRELLYTGVTRAQRRATVVATEDALRRAVAHRIQRASGLPEFLWNTQ
jgi:exodeoxyribonuclease V alpha subunit